MLCIELHEHGYKIGRKRVQRLMKIMGIEAFVSKPNTSKSNKANHIDPYLQVTEVDEVWYAGITYIPMQKGHTYLITIMA